MAEGADAVYVGAPGLNARAPGRDFSLPEIGAMTAFAHAAGVKVYIAMNSLVRESELQAAAEALACFSSCGADAVIVQDLGLLHLAGKAFPDLKLHASTLMAAHNSAGVEMLVELGCARVVLPRELTLDEITDIYRRTLAELEIFVHGAMCFSYSGLCLFSSLHGGKSSLRGFCVQPCRRSYAWAGKKPGKGTGQPAGRGGGYLFSMNDLCGIDLLPELAGAGAASIKIEGRLKSAAYVRKTVRAYRLMLDSMGLTGTELRKRSEEAHRLLDEAMGRRRSTGFFRNCRPAEAVSPGFSGNIGRMVGRVHRVEPGGGGRGGPSSFFTVSLRHGVSQGDRLRLHDEQSGERTAFTLHSLWSGKQRVRQGGAGQTVRMEIPGRLPGRAGRKFRGSLFRVDIAGGSRDEKKAREKILATAEGEIMPGRERALSMLRELTSPVASPSRGSGTDSSGQVSVGGRGKGAVQWWIRVGSFRDMQARLPMAPARYILPLNERNLAIGEKQAARYGDRMAWSLPPVILEERTQWYQEAAALLAEKQYTRFTVSHISQVKLLRSAAGGRELEIFGDYQLNILNSLALGKVRYAGLAGALFSIETDRENLAAALSSFRTRDPDFPVGMYVYGYPPLFSARLDDPRFEYGRRFLSPRGEVYSLWREDELTVARSEFPYSLLGEWKDLAKDGIDYLVVDMSRGNIRKNLSEVIPLYSRKGKVPEHMTGNYAAGLT